jgi:hypothetical protein
MLENKFEPNWRKNTGKGKLENKKLNNSLILKFFKYPKQVVLLFQYFFPNTQNQPMSIIKKNKSNT